MAQFTNQAQLSYNNAIRNSNIAVGEVLETLAATKTAVSGSYNVGDSATYAVSLVNSGTAPLTGITVTDNLGAYTGPGAVGNLIPLTYVDGTLRYFVNGVLQATPTVTTTGDTLNITGLNIPAGATAMLLYDTRVNQFAPLIAGSTIVNTATVAGGGITPITADETLAVATEPNLTITKSVSPVPVTENGTLTYTFVIQNTGNVAADVTDNASITDVFNPILENLTATFNGTPWVLTTDYTYDQTTGTFVSVPGRITVPAATYTQDAATGAVTVTPGVSTLVITGTV